MQISEKKRKNLTVKAMKNSKKNKIRKEKSKKLKMTKKMLDLPMNLRKKKQRI